MNIFYIQNIKRHTCDLITKNCNSAERNGAELANIDFIRERRTFFLCYLFEKLLYLLIK